jgi:NADH-ubiquinone oxidoreductase chain 6
MSSLYLLDETFTNGSSHNLLSVISMLSLLCGVFVVVSKNPIVSVLFLIGLFLNIASYLMLLGINFIGLSYLLVYVGAVSILFLFILMLINVRISELNTDNNNSIPLAVLVGILFNVSLHKLLPTNSDLFFDKYVYLDAYNVNKLSYNSVKPVNIKDMSLNSDISFVSSHIWDGGFYETSHITSIGNIIYTSYPLWLIITSVILLLAMVGTIVITIKQK